jgi:hypothetical protein
MGKDLIKHPVKNFIAALIIFAVAVGLALAEKLCVKYEMPAYLCKGMTVISIVLFVIDGIVVCGIAAITAMRLLTRAWRTDDEH